MEYFRTIFTTVENQTKIRIWKFPIKTYYAESCQYESSL